MIYCTCTVGYLLVPLLVLLLTMCSASRFDSEDVASNEQY
jgi:hypothetical protein